MTKTSSLVMRACFTTWVMTIAVPVAGHESQPPRLRSDNRRIQEVIRFALARSESFQDVVATLDSFDRTVYVEEGSCFEPERRSCLHLMPNTRNLVVHIDPRQPILIAAADLAHELYHAVEIGRAPEVVDSESLQTLYEQIGEQSCRAQWHHACWETRAAQAFEAVVTRQLKNSKAKW
jgi:hypothetical protein